WQPPSATAPVYLDVVGAAHSIPADERDWLRLQVDGLELVFVTRPGLRGDRITLSNLLNNPGFEAPSQAGTNVFSDTFATLNAYGLQAGAALTQDSGPTYADTVLADAPLCYYRLDEAGGTVVYDAGSLAQNGVTHGAPTQGVTGLLMGDADTCYTFASASSQYVALPTTGLPTGAAAFSIEAWVAFAANPSAVATIVWLGGSAPNKVAWLYLDTSGKLNFSTDGGTALVTAAALTTGAAHHVVATYDGAQMRLYLDGALSVGPSAEAFAITYASGAAGIGATATPNQFFSGQIDEVALYSTELSAARVAAHYAAGTTAPAPNAANTALLASGTRIGFGSPAWSAINQWQARFHYFAGATTTFYLHYTDASDYLAATISGTALTLAQIVGGVTHTLATTSCQLINGVHYWLAVTQFPCAPGTPAAISATVSADGAGASQGGVGAQLAMLGPVATWDSVTALFGAPQIGVSGGALGLGGAYASVHTLSLFGPGGWSFTPFAGSATAPASAAWEQATANTYAGGVVTSFGAARVDLPPTGVVDAAWESYSGGAPAGTSAIPAATGQMIAASLYARSTGLSATASIRLSLREWDAGGSLLRATTLQTLTGNQAGWTRLSGSLALGASAAWISLLAEVNDATAGASAGGTLWLDNAQAWNVSTSGVAAGQMPYCELRFPQSPAQLLVTGLLGDLPAPAHVAWGTYLANWPTGSTLTWALGRRSQASANARLVGSTLGYYGAALTPTSAPTLSATAWGGFYPAVTMNPGWNPHAFSLVPADAAGVYHLFHRFYSAQSAPNLGNLSVRVVTEQKSGAWYGALGGGDLLGVYNGPYLYAPLAA
ncbi:MAG TPA: LamG domain-containing protein, partial [Ktedonobacterales bacterium]